MKSRLMVLAAAGLIGFAASADVLYLQVANTDITYDNAVLKIFKDKAKFLVSGLMNANAAVLGASALGWED